MSDRDYTELYASLQKETTILTAQIRALYRELDKKFHLRGAQIPITFGFETDALGSYTRTGHHEKEHFHFSLLFVGYGVKNPLSKEDRMDLYKHEYAHYMEHHIVIPREYQWQPGLHGSAWKYCCSLVGAAPTPYYKAGEALMKHDYEKKLKNPIHDKTVAIRDTYRRQQEHKSSQASIVQYTVGEQVQHPKFGEGCIEKIEQATGSVTLHIRFGNEIKVNRSEVAFENEISEERNRTWAKNEPFNLSYRCQQCVSFMGVSTKSEAGTVRFKRYSCMYWR